MDCQPQGLNIWGVITIPAYLRISVPLGTGTASYSGSMSNDRYVNMAGYTDTFNDGLDSYSLNAGLNSGGGLTSATSD
ncbi:PapC protein [Escherichia coli]|uniref:PapC protein n=1 Tax=Escherichia coli TaxID=562 RepID=A0A376MM96_ECOLX|nr:PapC protein [Escherichia coli]